MLSITLVSGFDTPREEIKRLATESYATGELLNIELPISGQLFFIDTQELAGQFLHAAYFGQSIAETCSEFDYHTPSSIAAHESVEFDVVPKNVEDFVEAFWNAAIGYMEYELLEQEGIWDVHAAESREIGWDYVDNPALATHTGALVEHAQAILETIDENENEEEGDEEDN